MPVSSGVGRRIVIGRRCGLDLVGAVGCDRCVRASLGFASSEPNVKRTGPRITRTYQEKENVSQHTL